MSKEEVINKGHELDVYLDSEQSDQKTGSLDDLWQSIFDVVQLADGGIIESDPREIRDAIIWLKDARPLTEDYREKKIPFEVPAC